MQLGVDSTLIEEYQRRRQTISEHQQRIARYRGLCHFGAEERRRLEAFVFEAAARLEQTSSLHKRAEEFLAEQRILRPRASTLGRLVGEQRQQARDHIEAGLTIIDNGAERSVDSGFIDITARDSSGTTVVIELKAGVAGQRAVAQILSYMGDVAEEDSDVRGILVASGFDAKAKAASRMVPSLILKIYSVRFAFSDA